MRNRLYTIADLAIAFATLEAVRLPELPAECGDRARLAGAECATPARGACAPAPRRGAHRPARARPAPSTAELRSRG